jgi:hypothetical protein
MTDISQLTSLTRKPNADYRQAEKEKNTVALCTLATLGCAGAGLLISLISLAKIGTLESKPLPTLVQTIGGKTINITALQGQERSPEVIKSFTVNTLTHLFTWRQYLMPVSPEEVRNPKIDPGVPVETEGQTSLKLPSPVWISSFAVSNDFRKDFLGKHLAPLITGLKVLQGTSTVGFIPISIQDPVLVRNTGGEKIWKVKIVANLVVKTTNDAPESLVPFNKDVYVRAVIPTLPTDAPPQKDNSTPDLQLAISISRSAGLEITALDDFSRQDIVAPEGLTQQPATPRSSASPPIVAAPPTPVSQTQPK